MDVVGACADALGVDSGCGHQRVAGVAEARTVSWLREYLNRSACGGIERGRSRAYHSTATHCRPRIGEVDLKAW